MYGDVKNIVSDYLLYNPDVFEKFGAGFLNDAIWLNEFRRFSGAEAPIFAEARATERR